MFNAYKLNIKAKYINKSDAEMESKAAHKAIKRAYSYNSTITRESNSNYYGRGYNICIMVSEDKRSLLSEENLHKCGYRNKTDWLNACLDRFEKHLAYRNMPKVEKEKTP